MTVVGSGLSRTTATREAAHEATRAVTARPGTSQPLFGLIFAVPRHRLGDALAAAAEIAPDTDFIGCSTAGEFTEEGLSHDGIAVLAIATEDVTHGVAFAEGMKTGHDGVAETLCKPSDDLKREASEQRRTRSTSILLTDGLAGTGEQTVDRIMSRTSSFHHVAGGAAGDEGKFSQTLVGVNKQARPDAAAALHLFSSKDWGIGVGHGLEPASKRMRVTKAEGNVVFELDGKPAIEAYRAHAEQQGVELGKDNMGSTSSSWGSTCSTSSREHAHRWRSATTGRSPVRDTSRRARACAFSMESRTRWSPRPARPLGKPAMG